MENNKSYRLTPAVIAASDMVFRVPLYQRLFAWSTREVEQLMEDLSDHFEKEADTSKFYYLGMLTVVEQNGILDLIDGQQRVTALSLIALSLLELTASGKDCTVKAGWREFLLDKRRSPRLSFSGRSEDNGYFEALAKGYRPDYENAKMAEAIHVIREFLSQRFDPVKELPQFAQHVFNRTAVFATELPGHYVKNPSSLNEYFEAMNSSGKALEQHEILKVLLLKGQADENKIKFTRIWNAVSNLERPLKPLSEPGTSPSRDNEEKNRITAYENSLAEFRAKKFDSTIERLCNSINDGNRMSIAAIPMDAGKPRAERLYDKEDAVLSFEKFLLFILAINNNDDTIARAGATKLLQTFKDKPPRDIVKFYHDLLYFRLLLDLYVIRKESSPSGGIHTLMARNKNEEDRKNKANERVRQYQAMLNVSTELHLWLFPLLKYLDSNAFPSQTDILAFLQKTDRENGHASCPPPGELDFYHRNGARYWFWKLDYIIWERQLLEKAPGTAFKEFGLEAHEIDREAILNYEFRENRSIEHLHPQDQTHNEEWDWNEINRFGNLAMISASFNSYQRNWLVDSKLENLKPQIEHRSLQSLKLYFMYLQAKQDGGWTQGTVGSMQRHEETAYRLLKSGDVPSGTEGAPDNPSESHPL